MLQRLHKVRCFAMCNTPCVVANELERCNTRCMSTSPVNVEDLAFDTADRMRRALRVSHLGVNDMAEYLDVSRTSVSNWINGRIMPTTQTMRLWALRTGVPFEWLKTGKAPTLPSGPFGQYTTRDSNPEPADLESRRDELAARRTARSAVEVEQVAA